MPPISLWLGPQKQQRERVKGLLFILAVAVIWVVASFVVQGLEEHGLDPFLLSYIANSMFLVYLPVYMLYSRYQHSRAAKVHRGGRQSDTGVEVEADTTTLVAIEPDSGRALLEPASQHQTIKAALVVAPLWFMAQYTFNLSLSITTVTSNTILSSTSSLFTFGLACVLLHERFTPFKLVFIALTTAGTAIVTLITQWLYLASYVQLTTLTSRVLLITLCKGLFDNVLSDYLWARAVLLVGPTIATVGLSIQCSS
ncbi:hypothetical protein WJX72_009645 [[Myrmecia] bisecta]|uniref:EamA domain-containing protein n=1 Tax=[Myrmecia] bisecta TaxID=41462 RepID=A0AAW1PTQ5_9CHLO